ncbi:MAG: sodium:solute symporter family transporter, partial [Thermoguttaceae bacterium]
TYVFFGGLKACAWADLLQGSALIVGGGIVLYFAMLALGNADSTTIERAFETMNHQSTVKLSDSVATQLKASSSGWERFTLLNAGKLRMNLPWSDGVIPITALMLGLWIPNLYYWGLNQYIMQRTLGSKSLAEGQKGIVFAASMKLIIPFIVVFPGLIAFNLFHEDMRESAASHPNNGHVLAKLETQKESAQKESAQKVEKPSVFPFDADFAKVQQTKAAEIVAFNASVAQISIPDTDISGWKELHELNQNAVEVATKNGATAEKQLAGYDHDAAFPLLMKKLVPPGGFRGFILAAMLGAVISSLASMLNAASTIFTMDLYREYIHKKASDTSLVLVGRICVIVFMITSCLIAPQLNRPELGGIFHFIQEFQGFISPGILAVFLFGFLSKRAPAACGPVALLLSPVVYALLKWVLFPNMAFLDRMAITLATVFAAMILLRLIAPRKTPYSPVATTNLEMRTSRSALVGGIIVLIIAAILYAYFWDYSTPMFS